MDSIEKLAEYFIRFPGIGPRQAKRFVYFLLSRDGRFLEELAELILLLKKEITSCTSCFRFFATGVSRMPLCETCRDENRGGEALLVVEKDVDFENIERSSAYSGKYFVLGGTVAFIEKNKNRQHIRLQQLRERIEHDGKAGTLREVICAFSVTPEGEQTAEHIAEECASLLQKYNIKISTLGRGLSTGSELEYPDSETIKNALQNRA